MDTQQWGPNKNILVRELIKGKQFANKLQTLLHNPVDQLQQDGNLAASASAQQLVMKILRSFSDSISVLGSCDDDDSDELGEQIPAAVGYVGSTCSGDRASECSGEIRKRPAGKDRRGCYKRRKTSDSRIIVAQTPEDEYSWRKYGQKEILNAKHPRCYFRCTHKFDQGCKAAKQVQKLEDDSNMYHITYFSQHTCKNLVKSIQLFQEPLNSYLLSFESSLKTPNTANSTHYHPYCSSSPTSCLVPLVKEEPKQELSDDHSSADSNLWKEIIATGSSSDGVPAAIMGFDHHEDVVSSVLDDSSVSTSSAHGFDMDFLLKTVNFDCEFPFGEME